MSETQPEYDTDAEPTPGPWLRSYTGLQSGDACMIWSQDIGSIAIAAVRDQSNAEANARLIAAAGTAAQEAKEMEFDPVGSLSAVPVMLERLQRLEAMLEWCMWRKGDEGPNIEELKEMRRWVKDALASAEGSGDD